MCSAALCGTNWRLLPPIVKLPPDCLRWPPCPHLPCKSISHCSAQPHRGLSHLLFGIASFRDDGDECGSGGWLALVCPEGKASLAAWQRLLLPKEGPKEPALEGLSSPEAVMSSLHSQYALSVVYWLWYRAGPEQASEGTCLAEGTLETLQAWLLDAPAPRRAAALSRAQVTLQGTMWEGVQASCCALLHTLRLAGIPPLNPPRCFATAPGRSGGVAGNASGAHCERGEGSQTQSAHTTRRDREKGRATYARCSSR